MCFPPHLSDHSFIVANFDCAPLISQSTSICHVRNWREVDVNTMAADLRCSDFVTSPSDDLESMIDSYTTRRFVLSSISTSRCGPSVSRHVHQVRPRVSRVQTADEERRKKVLRTADARAAWRQQLDAQRQLYQSKFTTFWLSTVKNCQQNPRALWRTVNTILHPRRQHATTKLTATDFAKMANIRAATASAKLPVINPRPSKSFSQFQPATVEEIIHLINTMPAMSCSLDPIPTWLLNRLTPQTLLFTVCAARTSFRFCCCLFFLCKVS